LGALDGHSKGEWEKPAALKGFAHEILPVGGSS